jgi:hypothetical protein
VTFSALLFTIAALIATGVALLWANQSRNQPMFVAIAIVLFVAAEFVIGWWALPVVGLVLGLVGARRKSVGLMVGAAAMIAWALLFAWTASTGNLGSFMQQLAAAMRQKPGVLLSMITVLPALLAGPAARLGAGLRPDSPPEAASYAQPR